MKICIVTPAFPYPNRGEYYGLERYVENLAFNLKSIGNKITIITTFYNGGGRYDNYKGIKIIRLLDTKSLFKELGVLGFVHYISFGLNLYRKKNFKYCIETDVVILNIPIPLTSIFKLKGIPVVSVFHHYVPITRLQEYLTYPFYHFLEHSQYKTNKDVIAISESSKKSLIENYKLKNDNISIIPNGIDLKKFNPFKYSQKIKDKYGKNLLFYSGLMVPRKKVPVLLKAFKFVLKKRDDVHLLLSGDGPFLDRYKNLSKKLKINDKISFLGFIKDEELPKYYASSDLYILPSELEGFGQVILEAMASGTPVICADVPPMSDLIDGGGLTFKVNNPEDLADKILSLLQNKELLSRLKTNISKIIKKYKWTKIAEKYYQFCKELLENQSV